MLIKKKSVNMLKKISQCLMQDLFWLQLWKLMVDMKGLEKITYINKHLKIVRGWFDIRWYMVVWQIVSCSWPKPFTCVCVFVFMWPATNSRIVFVKQYNFRQDKPVSCRWVFRHQSYRNIYFCYYCIVAYFFLFSPFFVKLNFIFILFSDYKHFWP